MALVIAVAYVVFRVSPVAAQGQVYDPLPPPGSAYLRFVNALDGNLDVRPEFLANQLVGATAASRVTAYFVVEKVAGRDLVIDMREANRAGRVTLRAEPGSFVTVVMEAAPDGGIVAVPIVDQTDFNQTRARLAFYNATTACPSATLTLADSGAAVFQNVVPGTAKARSVNPVQANVVASCAGDTVPPFALQGVEAGGMYSIWLMQPASGAVAFLTRDRTTRWKP